jgi:histidine ammonia-lyase
MHIITSNPLSLLRLKTLVVEGSSIELSDELVQKIQNSRDYLDQKIEASSDPIYGINTGFGSLCEVQIHS